MYLGNGALPMLLTKRITISPGSSSSMSPSRSSALGMNNKVVGEKLKIEFVLTDTSANNTTDWQEITEESRFTKIHFILLEEEQLALLPHNIPPAKRMMKILDPKSSLSQAPRMSISLSDVLEDKKFVSRPHPTVKSQYHHELTHEIEIKMRTRRNNSSLHLVGFIQMDSQEFMEHKGISVKPRDKALAPTMGGPMTYDKVLETSEKGISSPPAFRPVLFVEDPAYPARNGEAYSGPAHYHDSDKPGPNGYVGWMAGPRGRDMGPRLRPRNIPSTKITLAQSSLLDESVDLSFASQTGRPRMPTGNGLDSFVGSVIDSKSLLNQGRDMRKMARRRLAHGLSREKGVMSYGSQDTCSIYVDRKNIEKSYHSYIFGVNFLNFLINESMFGDILNFHSTMGNEAFIQRALLYSEITSIKINRTRLSDSPNSFNRAGTPAYGKFEFGEVDKFLVYASDSTIQPGVSIEPNSLNIKNRLNKSETPLACLEEVEILKMSASGIPLPTGNNYRQFMIKDYDLFHNVEHGKYTYNVSISVRDGCRRAIKEILENLKNSIEGYEKYASEASIPVISNYQTGILTGNYNHELNQFAEVFIQDNNFQGAIESAIESYSEVINLISGTVVSQTARQSILNSVSPSSGTLSSVEEFLDRLNSLYGIVESTLDLGKAPSYGADIYHNKLTYVSSGHMSFSDILEDSFATNIIIESFNKTSLMADYSFGSTLPLPSLIEGLQARMLSAPADPAQSLGRFSPQAFISVSPSPFELDSIEVSKTQELNYSRENNASAARLSNQIREGRGKGGVTEISSFSSFASGNPSKKQFEANKIGLLRANIDNGQATLANNDLHVMQSLPRLGGNITLGLSAYGSNFSTPRDLFELDEFSKEETDGLPESVKSAISTAIYKGDDRELILESVKNDFKDLSKTKEQLGTAFDKMYSIFSMTQDLELVDSLDSGHKQSVLGSKSKNKSILEESPNPYKSDSGAPKVIGPDQKKMDLKLDKILKLEKQSTRTVKKFVIVSIDRKNKDKIVPVNNTFLLEV